jgi:hypothetical protein
MHSQSVVAERTDVLSETALVTGSLVPVNQSLANRLVDNRYCFLIRGLGRLSVATGYRLHDVLDVSAQTRTLACITLTTDFRLTGAFTRLSRVCQNFSPVPDSNKPPTMQFSAYFVNCLAVAEQRE